MNGQHYFDFDLQIETQEALKAWGADRELSTKRAVARALKRSAAWLRREALKESARALGITQQPLANRFKIFSKDDSIKLWVGTLELEPVEVGPAVQNSSGVFVRNRQFDGAFYRAVYGSQKAVYIRAARNQKEAHPVYRESRSSPSGPSITDSRLKGRFPLQRIGYEIEPEVLDAMDRLGPQINGVYLSFLEEELEREASK